MIITILQLNINGDNYWDKLTSYLTTSNFDILMLQELTGANTISGNIDSKLDCFNELQKLLGDRYHSELAIYERYSSSPASYMANAIFYKKQFFQVAKNIITLQKSQNPFPSDAKSFEGVGRNVLHLQLNINNKTFSLLTTHGAWAPTPQEHHHQTAQGEILLEYLKKVSNPFIFTGDFNLDPDQPLIKKISTLARNLTIENNTQTTLNPRLHRVKELFPPGVVVDYILVSHDLTVEKFSIVEEDLSDHLGLLAKIEV